MKVVVLNCRDRHIIDDMDRLARRISRSIAPKRTSVNLVLVNDRRIQELNRRYLRRNRPTDVLAFPLEPVLPKAILSRNTKLLGEVYVSREQARRQAKAAGISYYAEVRRLALHGILHLLGFNHREMEPVYGRYL